MLKKVLLRGLLLTSAFSIPVEAMDPEAFDCRGAPHAPLNPEDFDWRAEPLAQQPRSFVRAIDEGLPTFDLGEERGVRMSLANAQEIIKHPKINVKHYGTFLVKSRGELNIAPIYGDRDLTSSGFFYQLQPNLAYNKLCDDQGSPVLDDKGCEQYDFSKLRSSLYPYLLPFELILTRVEGH